MTDSRVMGLMPRITLAVVIFPHGAQKALGGFASHGFKGTMKYFTDSGISTGFALLAIAAEFFRIYISFGYIVAGAFFMPFWLRSREVLT